MKRIIVAMLGSCVLFAASSFARAEEKEAKDILDKAIKAIGGEEALGKLEAVSWKAKGKFTIGDNDSEFTSETTFAGTDRFRTVFEAEFNGNPIKVSTVLNGDKGWRKFGDNVMELDEAAVTNEKRTVLLATSHITLLPLKAKDFKIATAEGKVKPGDKPANVLEVTPPKGSSFLLYFDKETGLLTKMIATVPGFMGEDFVQESTFSEYKEMAGIKKATKVVSLRDGEPFITQEISDFKALDKAAAGAFDEPK